MGIDPRRTLPTIVPSPSDGNGGEFSPTQDPSSFMNSGPIPCPAPLCHTRPV
ncbi:UNVERIFIED_CONTAM: hypothetical protein Sradi_4179200 [Sesamum radiatum]|uniref:Uncharacterized protein n=1 Tax=Sesamum radiatum TaxID=300843 RepID=A0AAW2P2T1_SESRA